MKIWRPYSIDWISVQKYYDAGHGACACIRQFNFAKSTWCKAIKLGKIIPNPERRHGVGDGRSVDITGRRYGCLVAIRKLRSGGRKMGGSVWLCKCDCGQRTEATVSTLNFGGKKSCGCRRTATGSRSLAWQGTGEMSGKLWAQIKGHAFRRNGRKIKFTITPEYIWELFLQQNRKCALSGVGLSISTIGRYEKIGRIETTASLDRIHSDCGYIPGNVQWVHKWVNLMKLDHTQEEFLAWIERIHSFQCNKKVS